MNNNNHIKQLLLSVDWDLQRRRPFVVCDPMDPEQLLYMTEQDYHILLRTIVSGRQTLTVIARPGSRPPTDDKEDKSL
jgi:hypothetical protein